MRKKVKIRLFRLAAILIPFLFLIITELALRAVKFGPDLALFAPYKNNPEFLLHNPDVAFRYFNRVDQTGFGGDDVFKAEKSDSTLRIFVLGGSTTAGFPYFFNGRFSNQIRFRLQDAYPDHEIEVVNLGMTAVNSYTVRDFARECLRYQPNLLIIYAGHNEFYGAYGSASTQRSLFGTNRTLTLLLLKLKHLKIYRLLEATIKSIRSQFTQPIEDTRTLMARMAGDQTIPYRGPLYYKTLAIYKRNMEDIIRWTHEQQIPVVLGTLASNLRDQRPFVSIQTEKVNQAEFDKKLIKIRELMINKDYKGALMQLDSLTTQSPHHAQIYFLAGRCAEELKDYQSALNYFIKARDFDGLRFRAPSDVNQIIRNFAEANGHVFLTDIENVFARAAPHGLIGNEMMLEHLHPNPEGHFLMGKAFAATINDNKLLFNHKSPAAANTASPKSDEDYREQMVVTPLDERIAHFQLATLLSGWPFQPQLRNKTLSDFTPQTEIDKIAIKTLKKEFNYWEAHIKAASYYLDLQQGPAAIKECEALTTAFPKYWQSHKALAQTLIELKNYNRAFPALHEVIRLYDDSFSYKWIGTIYLSRNQYQAAIPYLEKTIELDPGDYQARYNLSGAYHLTGNRNKAMLEIEQLLKDAPDYPNAKAFYDQLKK